MPRKPISDLYKRFGKPEFFSSGCTLLDKAMSGGWGDNRILNIIGDSSTGKTLLAIVASKMYCLKYPKRKVHYIETEQAFDPFFAQALGIPEDNMVFPQDIATVEALKAYLDKLIDAKEAGLVIVDSLDAIATEEELAAEEFKAGYHGARKAEGMSRLFRQLNSELSRTELTVLIISQTRQKIGVVFGRKWTRAGGNALDFYASHVLVLSPAGKLIKTVDGIKRAIGITTNIVIEKNKFGPAYRTIKLPLLFSRGIDDVKACADWLKEIKKLEAVSGYDSVAALLLGFQQFKTLEEFQAAYNKLAQDSAAAWDELEQKFMGKSVYEAAEETANTEGPENDS